MLEKDTLVDGKYRILSEIGRGGMSVVYLAINEKANKTWAVKVVRKDGKNDYNMVRQGLITEIETLKAVKHSKLPSIVDVIEDADSFIIVMDYIEGRSMDKILLEKGPQPEEFVREWAKQLCDVLGYLHSRSTPIIYRDMKPSNIMLKPDGDITIIDFGTAKKYEIEVGATTGLGTAGYAAPEQYVNSGLGRTDARTDIYALGMTLFCMLTNIDPQQTLISDTSIRKINPAFSRGMDKIIVKCTQRDPDLRYQSCAELMYDLNNVETLDKPYQRKQRMKFAAFIASFAMSLICGVSGLVLNGVARSTASDEYAELIEKAAQTSDYNEKIALYEESIGIPDKGGDKEAYLGLIHTYKENDDVFSMDEAEQIERLVINHRKELEVNEADYVEICYEIGKLFWYHYNYGDGSDNQITKSKSAIEWFEIVKAKAPADYENLGMAEVYSNVGVFYRDITTKITEANDKNMYKTLFANLNTLMDTVAMDERESEIVRLELLEMARSAIHQYSTKFKVDGISETEMLELYDKISSALDTVSVPEDDADDVRTVKKKNTELQMEDTKRAITTAYATDKGGN